MTAVSPKQLIWRLNRRLAAKNQICHVTKGRLQRVNLGEYFIIETGADRIREFHFDRARLTAIAREEGALRLDEEIAH